MIVAGTGAACLAACSVDSLDPEAILPLGMPRPFSTEAGAEPLLGRIAKAAAIHIPPVANAPAPLDREISEGLERTATALDIIVLDAPSPFAASLEGVWREEGDRAAIDWRLSDADGDLLQSFTAQAPLPGRMGRGDTAARGRAILSILTRDSAQQLLAGLNRLHGAGEEEPARPDPAAAAPSIAVGRLAGAPGDGASSVPGALSGLLRETGLRLAERPEDADYLVSGQAELIGLDDGSQAIRISWQLLDPSGAEIGRVGQENRIPGGQLDGPWRENAYFAALGALEGLVSLIDRAERLRDGS